MPYTLTQARALLTSTELALFDASRAQPIKTLTPARLRGKVTRARALRDKYRDLYRRQSVSTRTAPAAQRSAVGGDNERTQRKADMFAEVLTRFEDRVQQLQAAEDKLAQQAAKKAAKTVSLKTAVAKALKTKNAAPAKTAPARSTKAPAAKRPSRSKAAAPSAVTPAAERSNPLRERSDNLAIHAHSKSQGRRAQGQRDSR